MNSLYISSTSWYDDVDITFPEDIKFGSYSVTVPLPSVNWGAIPSSYEAELHCILGEFKGVAYITSMDMASITFNFIRTDYSPYISGGLSQFPDTKVKTIGAFRAYDFIDVQDTITWKNIYGLKTKVDNNPIEVIECDHTPRWEDMDMRTGASPFGKACATDFDFRYESGEFKDQVGGQDRLMNVKLVKFLCKETGFYDIKIPDTKIGFSYWTKFAFDGSVVLTNKKDELYMDPSIYSYIVEDDKYDDVCNDTPVFPKQDSFVSVSRKSGGGSEMFEAMVNDGAIYNDRELFDTPSSALVGTKEAIVTGFKSYNWGEDPTDVDRDGEHFWDRYHGGITNKDGLVSAWSSKWERFFRKNVEWKSYRTLPSDVRDMMCSSIDPSSSYKRLELTPVQSGTIGYSRHGFSPLLTPKYTSAGRSAYYNNSEVLVPAESVLSQITTLSSSGTVDIDDITGKMRLYNIPILYSKVVEKVFLEAGKTYALCVQSHSVPGIVRNTRREKVLRFFFPEKFAMAGEDITNIEITRSRQDSDYVYKIMPSPMEGVTEKYVEHSPIDVVNNGFITSDKSDDTFFRSVISLNPKGDYYDFARGLRGAAENSGISIHDYNELLLSKIMFMDFKITANTRLDRFIIPVRDSTGLYRDIPLSLGPYNEESGTYDSTFDDALYYKMGYEKLVSGKIDKLYPEGLTLHINLNQERTKGTMQFAVRDVTQGAESDNVIANSFEDTHTFTYDGKDEDGLFYHYDFLNLNHDTAKEINNYIEVTDFPCQFQVGESWITTCSSNIVDVLNIDTIKETCTVRFYLPTAGYLL